MKKRWLILAAVLPLLGACVYDYEAELTGDQYTVVVEGDILVGGVTTIRFSRLNPEVLESQKEVDWSNYLSSSWDPSRDPTSSTYLPGTWDIPIGIGRFPGAGDAQGFGKQPLYSQGPG